MSKSGDTYGIMGVISHSVIKVSLLRGYRLFIRKFDIILRLLIIELLRYEWYLRDNRVILRLIEIVA